jgi:hypothetical protein
MLTLSLITKKIQFLRRRKRRRRRRRRRRRSFKRSI